MFSRGKSRREGYSSQETKSGQLPLMLRSAFSSSTISLDPLLVGRVAVAKISEMTMPSTSSSSSASAALADVLVAQRQHLVAEKVDAAADAVDALARDQRSLWWWVAMCRRSA